MSAKGPYGMITQREWQALRDRGANLAHIAVFALLRVRADRDQVCRDNLTTLAAWANCSHDTVERTLRWLRASGVVSSQRVALKGGSKGAAWCVFHRALPVDEWKSDAVVRSSYKEKSDAPARVSSGKRNATVREERRKSARRETQPLGDNPDVSQIESQTEGSALLRGTREELAEPTLPPFLEERLEEVVRILAQSKHAKAFTGKRSDLAAVLLRHPDKDAVQTAEAIAERMTGKIANGPAFFESWLANADDIEPPAPELTADEIRHRLMLPGDACQDDGCSVCSTQAAAR